MSILTYPLGFIGGGKEFYNGVIENSLRSNHAENMYLQRTPSAASNRRTFTLSVWVKKGRIGDTQAIFSSEPDGGNLEVVLKFNSDDTLWFSGDENNTADWQYKTNQVFRDVGSWYHIVAVVDTPQALSTERIKLFVNGKRITDFGTSTAPSQNYDTGWNVTEWHRIINFVAGTDNLGGYVTDIYSIDGYALGPENFGEYKEDVWIPKTYAGPPPIVSDSSSSNNTIVFNGAGVGHLNYDEAYIGESSIEFGNSNAYSATIGNPNKIESGGPFDFTTEDWTIDFWIRPGAAVSGSHVTVLHAEGSDNPSPADFNDYVWLNFDASGAPTLYVYLSANGGPKSYMSASLANIYGTDQWMHISVIRDNSQSLGQPGTSTIAGYGNGVQVSFTINSIGGTQEYITPTTDLATATYMDGKGMTLFGNNAYGYTSQTVDRKLDEFRIVKGEARPPRFYFGTQYGDASGGVLPQRATSTHRFTDDERTVLLIGGQSVNTHARAVSLVDESGLHLDNVHISNSSLTNYPTQDGVGKQFTISGAQHTTKESFIGNTSSVLVDGIDDAVSLPSGHSVPAGTTTRTIDYWIKVHDHETYGYTFGHGGTSPGTTFGIAARGSTSANHDYFFQGWGSGDFDLPKPLAEVSQDWQHLQVTWDGTTTKVYVDGVFANSKNNSINTAASAFEIGRNGRGGTEYIGIYFDEFRASTSIEPPQIKWTHTQTAGAGNKNAYDVNGWRIHGHEFSDDNATSLLVHGDQYTTAKGYDFDGTGSTYIQSGANISSDVIGNNTFALGIWYMSRSTGDQVLAHWGDRNTGKWPAIYISGGNVYGSTYGGDVTGTGFALGGSQPRFAVVQYDQGGAAYTAGDVVFHLDGLKIGENAGGTSRMSIPAGKLTIGTNITTLNDIAYHFNGIIYQVCVWNVNLTDDMIKDIYDAGATADLSSGTAINSGVNYGTTQANARRLHYAMGNFPSGTADTATAVVDRSSVGNDGVVTSGAVPSQTGSLGVFKDSSSANSIHHALISGGGIHHTKAVTLKSDGTNGTSTTDDHGNTIYFAGSNSTVTFANSSSFDYGNTSFYVTANNTLYSPAGTDNVIGTNQFGISMWVYISSENNNHENGLFATRGDSYEGIVLNVNGGTDASSDRLDALVPNAGGTAWEQNLLGAVGSYVYDAWNFVEFGKGPDNLYTLKQNGIVVASNTSSTSVYGRNDYAPRIGRATTSDSGNMAMTGYLDEVKFTNGEYVQSRFYLGNQAPVSDATFNEFKYVDFDGSADYYSIPGTNTGYDAFDFNGTAKFTLAAWVWNDASSGVQHMFGNCDASSPNHGWRFGIESGRFYSTMKGASGGLDSYGVKAESGWQLAHALFDGAGAKITHYRNGVEGTEPNSSNVTGDPNYSVNMAPSIGGRDGTATQLFNGRMSQICVWNRHLTEAEIQAQFELGLTGNWKTTYSTGMVGYYNFNIAHGSDTPSTSAFYDLSGNDRDMTGTSIAAVLTNYTPSNSSKRLTHQPLAYTSNVQANTAVTGNTHYGNVKAHEVNNSNFGSFVDDEYTVLLLRGGHGNGNTVFFDGNTAAGATITFPAHSHSFGKSRVAKEIVNSGTVNHAVTNEFGLHGTSIKGTGGGQKLMIPYHEDFDLGADGGDFTIEFWGYVPSGYTNNEVIASFDGAGQTTQTGSGGVNNGGWILGYGGGTSGTTPMINFHFGGQDGTNFDYAFDGTVSVGVNSWHHYAVIMRNGIVEPFVNGVSYPNTGNSGGAKANEQPIDNSGNIIITHKGDLWFFDWSYTWADFDGLIDEFRITKGIARYTPDGASQSGIVPSTATGAGSTGSSIPTSPYLRPTPFVATDGGRGYFANTNVKLWIKSDTYPGDTNFYDSAGTIGNTPKAITNADQTAANRPLIKTANSVTDYALSGGADGILFDNTDYIVVPNHEGLQLGNSDFTIEFWIRADSATSGIMGTCNSGAGRKGFRFFSSSSATVMNFYASTVDSGNDFTMASPAVMVADHWHHVVQQRISDEFNMIIDGVSAVRGSNTLVIPDNGEIYIGGTGSTANSELVGYLDEIRFSKIARYTAQGLIDSDYPNPTTEFGIQTEGSTYGRFDTQVTANTTYQRYNYQHGKGVSFSNFGDHSDYAGGGTIGAAGAVVGSPAGSGNFCIAWWQNADVVAYSGVWGMGNGTGGYLVISAFGQSSTQDIYISGDGSNWNIHSGDSGAPPAKPGEWEFRAISRQGANSIKFYHNGIVTKEITTRTDGTAIGSINQSSSAVLNIGRDSSNNKFDGKMSQWGMWHKGLSDAEIQDLYFAGPGLGVNWRTGAGISGTNYTSADGTSANLYLYFDMNNNPDDYTADDTTMTDRSANARGSNGTSSDFDYEADTKLLIHSNTDIDGDTSIVDSSASEHMISRVVGDPTYANTGGARTGMGDQGFMGIDFNKGESATSGSSRQNKLIIPTAPALKYNEDWSVVMWYKWLSTGSATATVDKYFWSYGAGYGQDGGSAIRQDGAGTLEAHVDYGGDVESNGPSGTSINDTNWHQIGCTVSDAGTGTPLRFVYDGTRMDPMALSGTTPLSGGMAIHAGKPTEDISTAIQNVYIDQVIFLQGHALTDTEVSNLYNSRNGNTAIGNLGGLIVHEEFANNTVTQNVHTTVIVHSNNATHHSQGSRKFYNDTESCRFTGTTGHAHAGKFDISADTGVFKFVGNTASRNIGGTAVAAMDNPQLRLKRGYSYVFDFGSSTGDGTHPFYFANSTANNTGFAYGSSGTQANEYITGLYGSQTAPTYANKDSLTWTPFTSGDYGNYGDGTGTTKWRYVKFEVPEDAPKNLYYRCSSHSTMGNAVFIMEKTEPPPVRVANLPALKTSGWNDRDYAGIGTNNSVLAFNANNYLYTDSGTPNADFNFGSGGFTFEMWVYINAYSSSLMGIMSLDKDGTGGTTNNLLNMTISTAGNLTLNAATNVSSGTWSLNAATGTILEERQWHHIVWTSDGTKHNVYKNGANTYYNATGGALESTSSTVRIGTTADSLNSWLNGFIDELIIYKGVFMDANTVINHYMTGRAGSHLTANSSTVLHIKSDDVYGSTNITDSSPSTHTITNYKNVYHHINDDRTANTALYFDGYSNILIPHHAQLTPGLEDFTYEAWLKLDGTRNPSPSYMGIIDKWQDGGGANRELEFRIDGAVGASRFYAQADEGGPTALHPTAAASGIKEHVWMHVALSRVGGTAIIFKDGVALQSQDWSSANISGGTATLCIGDKDEGNDDSDDYNFHGWMDGIRITNGMPRYTSGIPTDGQSPAKDYDDGRSSNVSSNTWATSSTRRYYGINTHTYLQTTQYSTDANTVLLIRGDDAETANDGVNMYGENGFHLEFKEVGSGDERDYNNFNTGVNGLGSDTSATQEFADDATVFLMRSRPNQANGSVQFVDEVDQTTDATLSGTAYHDVAQNIFGIDANTANVSVSSGGSGTY